jgi:hypothetical protein
MDKVPPELAHQRQLTRGVFNAFGGFGLGTGAWANWQEKKYDLRAYAISRLRTVIGPMFLKRLLRSQAIPCWKAAMEN